MKKGFLKLSIVLTFLACVSVHTKGVCYDGQNNIQQARGRFSEVAQWLNGGLDNYCYWNMVLNEEGKVYAVELPAQSVCAVIFDTEDN